MKIRKNKITNYKTVTVEDGVREETIYIAFDGNLLQKMLVKNMKKQNYIMKN